MDSVTLCFLPSSTFCPTYKKKEHSRSTSSELPVQFLQSFAFQYVVFLPSCRYWMSEVHAFVFICMLRAGEAQSQ